MPGIEHPPSTNGSPRYARRAVITGLALLSAVALAATAAAGTGDHGIDTVDAVASSTNTSFLEGQLQLVQARAAAEATAYEAQAAAATPVQVVVPPTVPPAPTTTAAPAPPTTAAPAPAPDPAPAPAGYGDPNDPASWDRLAQCEAGGNWAADTGNGYYGGLQFSLSSWQAVGGSGYPHENSRETQIEMGQRLYAQGGWSH
jgi:hypothetical protein